MENLVYVINLLKKYDGFYFIKKSLCKNVYRKWLGIFTLVVFASLLITIFFEKTYIYPILMLVITLLAFKISNLMDKDHKDFINQPLSMAFFKYSYLILRIYMIKKTLQDENLYNERFLNKTINECDTYLILEPNKTSFILKHPLVIILIAIIGGYLTNLIWANTGPNTFTIITALLIIMIQISPLFEDKCAKVRTVKFILQTLKNQMT